MSWAILLVAIGFYPALVLVIAITGPHNETERREKAQRKWREASPPPSSECMTNRIGGDDEH